MALNYQGAATGAIQGAQAGSMFGPKGAMVGGAVGGIAGLFKKDKDKPAKLRRRKAYTLTPEEISAYLPAQGLNIPGYTPYKPGNIVVGKGTKRWQEAEKLRLLNLEAQRGQNALAAARYNAAYGNTQQMLANNEGYGGFEKAQLEQKRLQDIARQEATLQRRGMTRTTLNNPNQINYNYNLANMALAGQLADRKNALLQQQANLYTSGLDSQPMPFNQLAQYSQMPSQVAGAQNASQLGAQQAYGAQRSANFNNALGNMVTTFASLRNPNNSEYLPFNPFSNQSNQSPPDFGSVSGSTMQPTDPFIGQLTRTS